MKRETPSFVRTAIVATLLSVLPPCAFAQADDEQLCQRLKGSTPPQGVEYQLAVGDVAWEEHDLKACAYVHIRQDFQVLGGRKLLDGDAWVRDQGRSGLRACTIEWNPGACFEDHDRDGVFEWGNGFWSPRPSTLRLPYKMEWRPEVDDESSRKELIYLGNDRSTARFSLREYLGDMKAPKSASEISLPLPEKGGEVEFRHLTFFLKALDGGRLAIRIGGRSEQGNRSVRNLS